ncbi:MAG: pyridoxal 5'-phosphate synthase glutaminase subunit PdxT [Thermoleophilaceae bacterium]|nr:pyridoxal 5'-phosphate synthase glutaminase subunit PdxT [Thermoleophilaceae bacterium]
MKLPLVGVLALQGGFSNHLAKLQELGVAGREVRTPADLDGLDALVLPGGESTTMTLGIEREVLTGPIVDFVQSGRPVLATCAGTILLDDSHLNIVDITCERNAYGRQTHSFEGEVTLAGNRPFAGVFIRAPKIVRVGNDVEVIATLGDEPVGVRSGAVTAYTFHPELTKDTTIHEEFIK